MQPFYRIPAGLEHQWRRGRQRTNLLVNAFQVIRSPVDRSERLSLRIQRTNDLGPAVGLFVKGPKLLQDVV